MAFSKTTISVASCGDYRLRHGRIKGYFHRNLAQYLLKCIAIEPQKNLKEPYKSIFTVLASTTVPEDMRPFSIRTLAIWPTTPADKACASDET